MADIDDAIRSMRIISTAILFSLCAFAAVAAAFRPELAGSFSPRLQESLLVISFIGAVSCAAAYFAIDRQTRAALREQARDPRASAEPLLPVLEPYRRLTVLRAALIEAPGLLALLSYLVGGSEASLVIAGASLLLLVATLPSRSGLERFADELAR
jgi:hypothetical protein